MRGKYSLKSRSVVICAMISGLLLTIGLYLGGIIRPARTMFHNSYVRFLETDSLPRWIMDPPKSDILNNWLYADFELNILVILASPHSQRTSSQTSQGFNEGALVQVSQSVFPSGPNKFIVNRTDRNRLFFMNSDGVLGTATLSEGSAEELYTYLELNSIHDDILARSIIVLKDNEEAVALLSNEKR